MAEQGMDLTTHMCWGALDETSDTSPVLASSPTGEHCVPASTGVTILPWCLLQALSGSKHRPVSYQDRGNREKSTNIEISHGRAATAVNSLMLGGSGCTCYTSQHIDVCISHVHLFIFYLSKPRWLLLSSSRAIERISTDKKWLGVSQNGLGSNTESFT